MSEKVEMGNNRFLQLKNIKIEPNSFMDVEILV